MDRNDVDWKGFFCAPTTPFTDDGQLDEKAWRSLIQLLLRFGVHGVVVGSTTGEWHAMSPAERVLLVETAVDEVDGRVPVLAGAHAFTPHEVVELGTAYAAAGADGVIFPPPPWVVPSPNEIFEFYATVSRSLALPIMVYNLPQHTGVDIDLSLAMRLSEIPTVVAIKDSTPDRGAFFVKLPVLAPRLRVFTAFVSPVGYACLTMVGGDGWICPGALMGAELPAYFEAVWSGNQTEALRITERWTSLQQALFGPEASKWGSTPALVKAAMNIMGQPGGALRPPLLPLTPENCERVKKILNDAGLPVVSPDTQRVESEHVVSVTHQTT